jgi:hypothetical protein
VPGRDSLHEQPKALDVLPGVDDKMHMVGHEAISVQLASLQVLPFQQSGQVVEAVLVSRKDPSPVVSPVDDVMRTTREYDACFPGHASPLGKQICPLWVQRIRE